MRPGRLRPARIFTMRNGVPVTRERASDDRRIWPPPSPFAPSISSIAIWSPLHAKGDVRPRAHRARDDAQVARARPDGPLARHEHVLPEVVLAGHVVVVAVHPLSLELE